MARSSPSVVKPTKDKLTLAAQAHLASAGGFAHAAARGLDLALLGTGRSGKLVSDLCELERLLGKAAVAVRTAIEQAVADNVSREPERAKGVIVVQKSRCLTAHPGVECEATPTGFHGCPRHYGMDADAPCVCVEHCLSQLSDRRCHLPKGHEGHCGLTSQLTTV